MRRVLRMRVIAVDPGETTGVAQFDDLAGVETVDAWHVEGQMDAVEFVRDRMGWGPLNVLVVEEFRISSGTARKTRGGSNTAIEIIGALRWIAHARGVPFVLQSPSDVMGFMTNDKLKRIGFYVPNEHARDAVRHLAYYLVQIGNIPREALLA